MKLFFTVALAFSTIATTSLADEECNRQPYSIQPSPGYEHTKWISSNEAGDILFEFGGFTSSFDGLDDDDNNPATQNVLVQPEWVAHEVRRYIDQGMFLYAQGFDRPRPWYEHEGTDFVDGEFGFDDGKKIDRSYSGEGRVWNRGHMATRSLVNRLSSEAGCNTHFFFNAVPQYGPMNSGDWLALERYTGALANKYGRAWAMNGPIFYEDVDLETIGGTDEIPIPIPHALFKVIVFQDEEEIFVRSYIFPQPSYARVQAIMASNGGKIPSMGFRSCRYTDQDNYDFSPYVASLTEIEGLTGIEFFPGATAAEKEELDAFSTRNIWNVERSYYARACGVDD